MTITPNRIAAALGSIASVATALYGVVGTLPEKWQGPALIGLGVVGHLSVVNKYLAGSQNWDRVEAELKTWRLIPANDPPPNPAHPVEPLVEAVTPAEAWDAATADPALAAVTSDE